MYLRLLAYVRPYWKAFALALLAMVLMAATEPLFPALMKPLLDKGFAGNSHRGSMYFLKSPSIIRHVLEGCPKPWRSALVGLQKQGKAAVEIGLPRHCRPVHCFR